MIYLTHINDSSNPYHGVYAHGKAEDELGYDLIGGDLPLNDVGSGMHEATLNYQDGILFVWERTTSRFAGLFVYSTDGESLAYAAQKYNEKPEFL